MSTTQPSTRRSAPIAHDVRSRRPTKAGFPGPAALVASIALLVSPHPAHALWPSDPSVNVAVCTAADHQEVPEIATDGAGGAIIVWRDRRNDGDHIYAQRVSAAGAPLWTENGVRLCVAPSVRSGLSVIPDGAGGAIATWFELHATFDIYAQRVSAEGVRLWSDDGAVVCGADGDQHGAVLVPDGAGGAIVTWWDSRLVESNIFAQRLDPAGASLWTEDGEAVCLVPGTQIGPAIAADGAGGAVIAWRDERAVDFDVYAQRVDASGALAWDVLGIPITTALGTQSGVDMIPDGTGGAIVVWEDYRDTGYDIYTQRIDGAGATRWTPDGVLLCDAADWQTRPRIVSDGRDGAIVTWQDFRTLSHLDIYAQSVDANGVTRWLDNGAPVCTRPGTQVGATIAADGAGGAIVTWSDGRDGAHDIYAVRIDAAGSPMWPADGVVLSSAVEDQQAPAMIARGAGAIVTWKDWRPGPTSDVYAQHVNADGSLGPTTDVPGGAWSWGSSLSLASENPARRAVRLRLALDEPAWVRLVVVDAAGREVTALEAGMREAGSHEISWDTRDRRGRLVAGGVYWARLESGRRAASVPITVLR